MAVKEISKYQVGDLVKVTECIYGGNFCPGDVVKITEINNANDGYAFDGTPQYGAISPYDGTVWFLYDDEIAPATNGDYIRNMNDTELAEFIHDVSTKNIIKVLKTITLNIMF